MNPVLEGLDTRDRLSSRQLFVFGVAALIGLFEFYDQFIIAFVLSFMLKTWGLTYFQAAFILLSSGIGSIIGSFAWGYFADRVGRKLALYAVIATFAACSAAMAFTPDGNWVYLLIFRVGVGTGVGGYVVTVALVQEYVPANKRGLMSGLLSIAAPLGLFLGATSSAYVAAAMGWRFLFVLGAVPALIILPLLVFIPESPHWLLSKRRVEEARRSLAWALGTVPANVDVATPSAAPASRPAPRWLDLFSYPRHSIVVVLIGLGTVTSYYGLILWAPTLLMHIEGWPVEVAARTMMGISLVGVVARILFSIMSEQAGRKPIGLFFSLAGAVLCLIAGFVGQGSLGNQQQFWLFLAAAYFLMDGGFAVSGPYTTEIWPSSLRASGSGLGYGAGGLGKIAGPLCLALLSGSSNYVTPTANGRAIETAFGFFAACLCVSAIGFAIGRETRGKTLDEYSA
jgi:MFS transporter, putative metabolite:H+ symporter